MSKQECAVLKRVSIMLQEVYSPIAVHITSQGTWWLKIACRTAFFFSSGACIREGLAGFEADVGILFSLGTELGKDTA